MENLRRIPIKNRLQGIGYLLKHSVTVVGDDWSILKPAVLTSAFGIGQAAVFFIALGMLVQGGFAGNDTLWMNGWIVMTGAVVLWFAKFFYFLGWELRQSAMIYDRIAVDGAEPPADRDGPAHRSAIWRLALIDIAMAYVKYTRQRRSRGLINLILAGFLEVWDLVSHYILPAVAIDGLSLRNGIAKIKELRHRVPATLAGVFGIDLFGRTVTALAAPIHTVMGFIAIFFAWYLGPAMPTITFSRDTDQLPAFLLTDGELILSLIPFIAFAFIGKVGSVVIARGVTWVKVNYFTIFYVQIEYPDRIRSDLQQDLVDFLRMEDRAGSEMGSGPTGETA